MSIDTQDLVTNKNVADLESSFEVILTKKDFARALSHMQSVVEKRNIIPILSNVMISATGGQIELKATDMDIVASEKIEANVVSKGEITVDASTLHDIVRKLDDKEQIKIKFNTGRHQINICSGSCDFNLSTLPVTDFPKLDDLNYDFSFKIAAEELKNLIDKCKFAISNEETRYNLNGLYMNYSDSSIEFVATDGHRLSIAKSTKNDNFKMFEGIIIPKKTVMEIRKIIDEVDGNIFIDIASNKIKFHNTKFSLTSKLIDAKFPDYSKLIPNNNDIILKLQKSNFATVVDRVATITNEKFRGVRLTIEENSLMVNTNSESGGSAKEIMQISSNCTEKFEIGFNSKYILEGLNAVSGDELEFTLKDPFSPAIIKSANSDDFKYIIMPMRV